MTHVSKDEKNYYLFLRYIPKLGKAGIKKLLDQGWSPREIWREFGSKVARVSRIKHEVEKELVKAARLGFDLITPQDDSYPRRLWEIHDPPFLLYTKGKLIPKDEMALAVVGTRNFSAYGRDVVESIVPQLVGAGLTVVSGMARGIDSIAHKAAIDCGGRTIAVLGSGLDVVYPPENRDLFEEISAQGAVVSEFPLGFEPNNYSFPVRNRVISGLSLGVWVVEAPRRSGALITADLALSQGREVFALPGSVFSQRSVGPNWLIKQGAVPVTEAKDILDVLELENRSQEIEVRQFLPETEVEKLIHDLLSEGPMTVDNLIRHSGFSAAEVNTALSKMEIKGVIREIGNSEYRKV
ncbi:DNA protecting protein DprA [candidate division CPR3 bacterium 4484_211]|uniref:DNA protecting protein DprA n=1 Tax=candidate division CPR3 bacterium 4484_211 TaxID=1968527 RepID=A0A1W9NXD6_UNCC3|nr:MAG: DNA protecting protein DprA [candidate division CPR3 bacterium 4484_211]